MVFAAKSTAHLKYADNSGQRKCEVLKRRGGKALGARWLKRDEQDERKIVMMTWRSWAVVTKKNESDRVRR